MSTKSKFLSIISASLFAITVLLSPALAEVMDEGSPAPKPTMPLTTTPESAPLLVVVPPAQRDASPLKTAAGDCGSGTCPRSQDSFRHRWVFAPSIRYYRINTAQGVQHAYSSNGLPAFDRSTVGAGLEFYYRTDSDWQLGISMEEFGNKQESGADLGEFTSSRLGAWIGKDLLPNCTFDVTPGAYLGFGGASLLVLSGANDGRIEQSYAYAEPTISFAYQVSPRVKIGTALSYLLPIDLSTEAKGDNLGLSSLTTKAWSAQFQLHFGHF